MKDLIEKKPLLVVVIVLCLAIMAVDAFVPVFFIRNHYSKHFSTATAFRYRITGECIERTKSVMVEAEVCSCFENGSWNDVCGKIRLYLPKSDSTKLHYGDVIESSAVMYAIKNRAGLDFDYRKYMKHKRIYHNVFLKNNSYIKVASNQYNPIKYAARKINKTFCNRLLRSGLGKQEAALATGMLLGDKHLIDYEIKRTFSTSGLGHVLCVSGLHIGLIIGLFNILLKRISQNHTYFLYSKILLILLAFFISFITGFTPASLRAAVMFSVLITDIYFGKNYDKLNLLSLVALIFLLCNPLLLFDISFQLSFLAMAGIYTIFPVFESLYEHHKQRKLLNKIIRKLLLNAEISISAQVFVIPLIAYYFRQIPTYFLLANIVVVPFVSLILGMIILILVFVDVPFVGDILAFATDIMLKGLIIFTSWVDKLPFSTIK
jgi:competence protein ComEC